jgi:hypothetical protein
MPDITVQFEKTDLFGGEANYAWVERQTVQMPEGTSDRALVRRAKAWAGWTGLRCKTEMLGDMLRIDATPAGMAQVLFVTFE